ncbi:unnamed protein product [Rhizophagus irregularis]|nr:unnamed protein product [Rhizophagus irregularis]
MEVIEILDEEVYDANKDTQNIQILPINSDSSSDNETKMAYFTKNLGVSTVIYSTVPIEYPATSSDGVATVFSIQGWKDHMDAFNDIQYSIGGGGGSPIQKNDKEHCTYTIFLAAQDSHLVDTQQIDIDLLRKLFNGEAIMEKNIDQCSTIISKSSRTKKCAYIHYCNGSVTQGKIVDKPCNVKMYKFIPNDLQECPFVALVCVGIHNHPPPPPERTPNNIKDNLQSMIKEAIENDDAVTSGSIIQGNMLKAYFNKETLQEIHMSLNNIDRLRYLVAKTYKNIYPFGQHILGVFQSVFSKQFDLHNYIHKIDFFGDGLVLIICMLEKQAQLLQHLECFQIDLSFKRVKGDINEFEINSYDDYHNLILSYCRIYTNSCQVHFQRNLHNKHFSDPIKKKMISLLKATSKAELDQIFSDIEKSDEDGVNDWIDYYQRPYILATINSSASLMDVEIWNRYENNTNTAEAAHSLVNRTGKQLKLLSAILRGRNLDERHLKIIEIQDFSAVPYTKQDKSQVKRQLLAINRKDKRNQKNNEDKNSLKRKSYSQPRLSKIQSIDENDYEFESDNLRSKKVNIEERNLHLELEIEERKMNLKERDIALRKAAAEVEAIEIANEKAKLALKFN